MEAAATLSSRCLTFDVPGMGSITGLRLSTQASAICAGLALCALGDVVQQRAGLGQIAGRQRKPGNETDALLLAIIQHRFAAAIDQIVAVLHRGDREDFRRRLDLGHRDFAEAGMADQAFVQHFADGAELFVARHLGIDAMQLPQRDLFDTQLLQAFVDFAAADNRAGHWASRSSVRAVPARPWWRSRARIGMQRFADQLFRNIGAVGIRRVDEIDAQFRQALQGAQGFGPVCGLVPRCRRR